MIILYMCFIFCFINHCYPPSPVSQYGGNKEKAKLNVVRSANCSASLILKIPLLLQIWNLRKIISR